MFNRGRFPLNTAGLIAVGIATTVAIAAFIFVGTYSALLDRDHERTQASVAERRTADIQAQCFQSTSFDELVECVANETDSDRSAKQEKADLHAQQDVAALNVGMLWFSGLGFVTSGIGVILLIRTLNLQRLQFGAERRPWVQIKDFTLRRTSWSHEGIKFHCEIELQNVGQSPALEVFCDCAVFCDSDFDEPVRAQTVMREKWRVTPHVESGAIFPTDTLTKTATVEFSYADVERIWDARYPDTPRAERRRTVELYPKIYGVVRYRGRHADETHTTTFMYYVTDAPVLDDPFLGKFPVSLDIERNAMRPIRLVKFYKGWDAD